MDYIRIKTTRLQDCKTTSGDVTEFTVNEVKELLKDWIKLYPNSFSSDVEFKIYQLADGDIIIELHDDLSSMAVSLLVLYFNSIRQQDNKTTRQQDGLVAEPIAFITIDDTEVLLKQNEGKRAMVFCRQQDNKTTRQQVEPVETPTSVRFLLEDNYALDYNFEKRPQPVKDCDMKFEEAEISLPEEYESVMVGDVVKNKVDEILEGDALTPTKMLIYLLCGAIGLSIVFLIVYFLSK